MLFEFLKSFGPINTHNFVQINIITPNFVYYKIVQLTLRYEYCTILFSPKTYVRCIRNIHLKNLFEYFNIFGPITTHNLVKINIVTPNYAN
jgi:hypothetical protein